MTILHIARRADWDDALRSGSYRVSTLGATIDRVGFVHGSFPDQVAQVAELLYADTDDELCVLVLDEHAAGRTVTVGVGRVVELDLHSTYWSAPHDSAERVLVPLGTPAGVPGTNCHPGSGCGVMRARYTAERAGTATLTAQRSSCGEAMACPPGSRTFTVSVHVVMAG